MNEGMESLSLERIGKSIREKYLHNDIMGIAILVRGQEAFNFANWSTWWNGVKHVDGNKFSFNGDTKTLEIHATSSAVLLKFIEEYANHLRGNLKWLEAQGLKVEGVEIKKKES